MNIEDLRKYANSIEQGELVKKPLPVSLVGTTFGNELQSKINNRMLVNNVLLMYLCIFFTARFAYYGY